MMLLLILKSLTILEDVLKTDLNCSDLQNCMKDFEEENLYNNQVENLERLEHSEELNLHSKTKTEDSLGEMIYLVLILLKLRG